MGRKRKKREWGAGGRLRSAAIEELLAIATDHSTEPALAKEARRELQRRRTQGVKVEVPAAPRMAVSRSDSVIERGQPLFWMTYHIFGFAGQILAFLFREADATKGLIILYTLEPARRMNLVFLEEASQKFLKKRLESFPYLGGGYAPAPAPFGLSRLGEVLEGVKEEDRTWHGKRAQIIDLLGRYSDGLGEKHPHPAQSIVPPPEETRNAVLRDSSALGLDSRFEYWLPDVQTTDVLIENLMALAKGTVSVSERTRLQAMDAVFQNGADAYFEEGRRKIIATALLDNAWVAWSLRDRKFAWECAVLSTIVADTSIAPREIGFLVECMRRSVTIQKRVRKPGMVRTDAGLILPGIREEPEEHQLEGGEKKLQDGKKSPIVLPAEFLKRGEL